MLLVSCIKISLSDDDVKEEPLSENKGPATDLVKEDLENYLYYELLPVSKLEDEALDYYDAVTGPNYTNDETFYNSLIELVIPLYQYFIDNEKLDKARKLIRQWDTQLEELCKKHGVKYDEQPSA